MTMKLYPPRNNNTDTVQGTVPLYVLPYTSIGVSILVLPTVLNIQFSGYKATVRKGVSNTIKTDRNTLKLNYTNLIVIPGPQIMVSRGN